MKIFSLTLNNTSTNDVSLELLKNQLCAKKRLERLGEYFYLRCCAHIKNIVVQEGLKEIDDSGMVIRESIKYVTGFQVRK